MASVFWRLRDAGDAAVAAVAVPIRLGGAFRVACGVRVRGEAAGDGEEGCDFGVEGLGLGF